MKLNPASRPIRAGPVLWEGPIFGNTMQYPFCSTTRTVSQSLLRTGRGFGSIALHDKHVRHGCSSTKPLSMSGSGTDAHEHEVLDDHIKTQPAGAARHRALQPSNGTSRALRPDCASWPQIPDSEAVAFVIRNHNKWVTRTGLAQRDRPFIVERHPVGERFLIFAARCGAGERGPPNIGGGPLDKRCGGARHDDFQDYTDQWHRSPILGVTRSGSGYRSPVFTPVDESRSARNAWPRCV